MSRASPEIEANGTEIAPALPDRLEELARALGTLRSTRDVRPIRSFFERYAAAHREAELQQPLHVARREWQDKWLEVKDLLGSRMPRVVAPNEGSYVIVRKLGWSRLGPELARAWALARVAAPEGVMLEQKRRVRAAYQATGWDERHAPPVLALPEFDFWSLPVRSSGRFEFEIGELDAETSERQAWGHAEELILRALSLCIPPSAQLLRLSDAIHVTAAGRPLIDAAAQACVGWVEPRCSPHFASGDALSNLEASLLADDGVDAEQLDAARRLVAEAARHAASAGHALAWWRS